MSADREGDYEELSESLRQYRKINASLKRKIKSKDARIQQLFGFIEDAQPHPSPRPDSPLANPKLTQSEHHRPQKENRMAPSEDNNIFRQSSLRASRPDLHLPALSLKRPSLFQADPDNPETRCRPIRLPLSRLVPLNSQEVKRRFLLKYQRE